MNARIHRMWAPALVLIFTSVAAAGDQPTVRAALQTPKDRKPAPSFTLKDASGRPVKLKDYRGKIVLLDFWATWCGGCKEEIPWFSEFQKTYSGKGFAVVGVSLDDDGWKVLKPFLAGTGVSYQILLGDQSTAQHYGIGSMPDTFLIDRKGRIAAAYAGLVDKDDVEANIKTMLFKQ